MRIRHIEAFHAVYTNSSISAAARALKVSQPSLSKVLKHAEDQLGFALFRRVKGRLLPTNEAHALFREVAEVQQRLTSLRKAARNLRGANAGHLRIAVVPSIGLGVAPAAIARFRKRHPAVTFETMTQHHGEMLRALSERRSELAIAYAPAPHPRLKPIELGRAELVLLYRRRDLPALPPRVGLEWLQGRDLIGVSTSGPLGEIFAAAAARHGLAVRETVSVQTYYLAAALVRHGTGLAIVDELTARASLHDGMLEFRPLEPALGFSVAALHLKEVPPSLLAARFLQTLRAVLGETLAAP